MRWNGAAVAAAILLLSATAVQSAEPQSSKTDTLKVTVSDAPATTSAYSGSQCDSNTYSGQCHNGNCQCVVISGNVCESAVNDETPELKTCDFFLTIDNGLATGSPGCSPVFGVANHLGSSSGEFEVFLTGTYCPIEGTNFSGGLVVDEASCCSSGDGTFTGEITASTFSFDGKATLTLK